MVARAPEQVVLSETVRAPDASHLRCGNNRTHSTAIAAPVRARSDRIPTTAKCPSEPDPGLQGRLPVPWVCGCLARASFRWRSVHRRSLAKKAGRKAKLQVCAALMRGSGAAIQKKGGYSPKGSAPAPKKAPPKPNDSKSSAQPPLNGTS